MNGLVLLSSVVLLMLQLGSSNDVKVPPGLTNYGDMTYWGTGGMTACGTFYNNNDSICAVNPSHWVKGLNNPHFDPVCGKRVKVWDPNTTHCIELTVEDQCGSCLDGDIDVSPTSFVHLQPAIVGRYKVHWGFINCSDPCCWTNPGTSPALPICPSPPPCPPPLPPPDTGQAPAPTPGPGPAPAPPPGPSPAPAPPPDSAPVPPGLTNYGDMTYWEPGGMTACGTFYNNNDSICGINPSHWVKGLNNPHFDPVCGKRVKVWDPSTTQCIELTVEDQCGGCLDGDINVSQTSFVHLQPAIVGRYKVHWGFINCSDPCCWTNPGTSPALPLCPSPPPCPAPLPPPGPGQAPALAPPPGPVPAPAPAPTPGPSPAPPPGPAPAPPPGPVPAPAPAPTTAPAPVDLNVKSKVGPTN